MLSPFRIFTAKLGNLFHQPAANQALDDELQTHLNLLTERFVGQGMSPQEAASAARRQFGNSTLLQQRHREQRTFLSFSTLHRDLRFATRQLLRNPTLTVVAITSLALGIGANTAIFTIAKKVLFDSLPVKDPHQLRMLSWVSGHDQRVPLVWGDASSNANGVTSTSFSYPVFEELRKKTDAFQDLFAFKDVQMTADVDGNPDLVYAELVSGNTFTPPAACILQPILGRTLSHLPTTPAPAQAPLPSSAMPTGPHTLTAQPPPSAKPSRSTAYPSPSSASPRRSSPA